MRNRPYRPSSERSLQSLLDLPLAEHEYLLPSVYAFYPALSNKKYGKNLLIKHSGYLISISFIDVKNSEIKSTSTDVKIIGFTTFSLKDLVFKIKKNQIVNAI